MKWFSVKSIAFDQNEDLWIGYNFQHLSKIDPKGNINDFTNLLSKDIINVTNIVAVDDGYIWVCY